MISRTGGAIHPQRQEGRDFMTVEKINALAGSLIEYGMELSDREHEATKKEDFETLRKICDVKTHIAALLEALDKE